MLFQLKFNKVIDTKLESQTKKDPKMVELRKFNKI